MSGYVGYRGKEALKGVEQVGQHVPHVRSYGLSSILRAARRFVGGVLPTAVHDFSMGVSMGALSTSAIGNGTGVTVVSASVYSAVGVYCLGSISSRDKLVLVAQAAVFLGGAALGEVLEQWLGDLSDTFPENKDLATLPKQTLAMFVTAFAVSALCSTTVRGVYVDGESKAKKWLSEAASQAVEACSTMISDMAVGTADMGKDVFVYSASKVSEVVSKTRETAGNFWENYVVGYALETMEAQK